MIFKVNEIYQVSVALSLLSPSEKEKRMSYQVLARKWRPHQFKDVVGQSHVLTALSNALDHNRLHHAYLFSGTRGVGKTTIARIFAKALNCEEGISASPCGVCATCQEIDQGRYVDLLEIDAASRTKVEDTRELLDNVQYKPARGRFKVYLIDEVHMLSRNSFNALLKTLEEPPEYVKFLLATTDPQKLPVTILSRCLQFHLKHLDAEQIKQQLIHVLEQESFAFEPRALAFIARAAEGSMRDALSLTDQAIALGNGVVDEAHVVDMLGTLSTDQAILLLDALSLGQADPVMQCVSLLAEKGIEWDGLLKELATQIHRIAMAQVLPESVDKALPDAEFILALSQKFTPQDIQLFYQILLQGRQDLPYAPDGRAGLEMVLLRMLAFKPVTSKAYTPSPILIPAKAPSQSSVQTPSDPSERIQQIKAQLSASFVAPVSTQQAASQHGSPNVQASQTVAVKTAPSIEQEGAEASAAQIPITQEPVNQVSVNTIPVNKTPVDQKPVAPSASPSSSNMALLKARNALRSRTQAHTAEGTTGKKTQAVPEPVSSQTAIERLAQKYNPAPRHLVEKSHVPAAQKADEGYRWTPTQGENEEDTALVTPKIMKQALAHEKTPEMKLLLEQESTERDPWCRIASALSVSKRAKLLVLNSVLYQNGDHLTLGLRDGQKHLISDKLNAELTEALKQDFGDFIELKIEITTEGITPLEWRDKLYEEKLMKANQSLKDDPNVAFFCQRFMAKIEEDSVRPL
jgi:DNA polymerase-3 subunit gamma/tau